MTSQVAGWVFALPLFVTAVVFVLWGLDLVSTQLLRTRTRRASFLWSGSFWLGAMFIVNGLEVYGQRGYAYMLMPDVSVDAWQFAVRVFGALAALAAWFLLTFESVAKEERGNE